MMTIKKEKLNFYLYTFSLTTLALGLVKGQLKEQNYFSLYLFTRQTVVLVNIYFIIVFWTGKENNKYFSFITFINSTLTMVLYMRSAKAVNKVFLIINQVFLIWWLC
ncbi:MAG: hypothetical protein WJU30_00500 [Candidatus Phytoplasma pruni]